MKRFAVILGVMLGSVLLPPSLATAGDVQTWRYNRHNTEPPYPLSARTQSIWASGACWSECGSYTAWNMAACLERDTQGRCLKLTDAADRYCQRECRTSGGPWLPFELPWD